MDKIEELKAQIEVASKMEQYHKEMWKLYYARAIKLNTDLFFEELEIKAADERLNSLIHFCQTGEFLDE